jgi:hypothetical protein
MAGRQLTQIYLDTSQKTALQKRAKAKGTKVAEEVRKAVDAYLAGVTPEDLDLLDQATIRAEQDLKAMATRLDATNKRLEDLFAKLDRLKKRDQAAA